MDRVLRRDLCLRLVLIGSFKSWRAGLITINQVEKREGTGEVGGKWGFKLEL